MVLRTFAPNLAPAVVPKSLALRICLFDAVARIVTSPPWMVALPIVASTVLRLTWAKPAPPILAWSSTALIAIIPAVAPGEVPSALSWAPPSMVICLPVIVMLPAWVGELVSRMRPWMLTAPASSVTFRPGTTMSVATSRVSSRKVRAVFRRVPRADGVILRDGPQEIDPVEGRRVDAGARPLDDHLVGGAAPDVDADLVRLIAGPGRHRESGDIDVEFIVSAPALEGVESAAGVERHGSEGEG